MEEAHSETKRCDLAVPIEERFTLESRLAFSAAGQVFKAIDRSTRSSVALWISRKAFSDTEASLFLRRAGQLAGLAGQPEACSFGLDPMRHGWVLFRLLSGRRVIEGRLDLPEAERRWLGCVRAVERLHKAGIACGDVGIDSFVMMNGGDVRFFGGLGVASSPASFLSGAPKEEAEELALYLAPEQLEGQAATLSTDVLALARLAYRFFSGKPLAQSAVRPGSSGVLTLPQLQRAPAWFPTVVMHTLACAPEERPQDASALIQALLRERTEVTEKSQVQSKARTQPEVETSSTSVLVQHPRSSRRRGSAIVVGAAVLLGALFGLVALSPGAFGAGGLARIFSSLMPARALSQEELSALSSSDDPMAHEALLRMANEVRSAERSIVIDVLLSRSRRLGLPRAADLVRQWSMKDSSVATLALKAINPSLPDMSRVDLVAKVMKADLAAGAQLAAALGLDLQNKELFRQNFEVAARDQGRVVDTNGRSTAAVMAAIAPVRGLYLVDLVDESSLSKEDVIWLLARLGEQGEPNLKSVAALGLKNGTFQGPQRVFAEALTAPTLLSPRERAVFVACLAGTPSREQAVALTSSYNPSAARALFAVLWLSPDPATREAAMDGLFAKPLGDASLQAVADYIKGKNPNDRDRYSKVFAAAGLSDLLTDDEFSAGFALTREGSPEPGLISVLLQRAPSRVVFEVLESSGDKLQAPVYLDLLKHPSKEVRVEALKRLRNFNDATMYALVRQMYDDERDGDVRREYEQFLNS